jgi:hypothetical protein
MQRKETIKWLIILNAGIIVSAALIFSAVIFNETHIRQVLYEFWAVHFLNPTLPLRLMLLVLALTLFSLLYINRAALMDIVLTLLGSLLLSLFILMQLLNLLNLGSLSLPGYLFPPSLPLAVMGVASGMLASSVIVMKGLLLYSLVLHKRHPGFMEKMCLASAFGFGTTSLEVMILALLKVVYQYALLTIDLSILGLLACLMIFLQRIPRKPILPKQKNRGIYEVFHGWFRAGFSIYEGLIILALAVSALIAFYYSSIAVVEWDSLAYMANYAELIFLNHGVLNISGPSIGLEMSASYPIGFQALGVYFYEYIGGVDDFYLRILPPIFFTLSLVATYLFAGEILKGRLQKLVTVLLVAVTPVYYYYAALSAHYMTYLVFLSTMSLLYSVKYLKDREKMNIFLASVFAGLSSIMSYIGLAIFLFPFAAVLWIKPLRRKITDFGVLTTGGLIPLSYLIRNWLVVGDPIYPFLTRKTDLLWSSRDEHFRLISIYTGLNLRDPFSIIDFLYMRLLGVRPWVVFAVLCGAFLVLFMYKKKMLKELRLEERFLLVFLFISIMLFMSLETFERYILPMIAIYATFFAWMMMKAEEMKMHRLLSLSKLVVVYSIFAVILASQFLNSAITYNYVVNYNLKVKDKLDYVALFYPGDAETWRWINENTGKDEKVATFDIRTYYIEREIVPLDGQEASVLYGVRIEKAIEILKTLGVTHILSTPWVSPMSHVAPPAYFLNPLTPYLGDPRYLPVVYSKYSSAVYQVGPLEDKDLPEQMMRNGEILPILNTEMSISLKSANFSSNMFALAINIPADYYGSVYLNLGVKANQSVSIDMWAGLAQGEVATWVKNMAPVVHTEGNNPNLTWGVSGGGYTITFTMPQLDENTNVMVECELSRQ